MINVKSIEKQIRELENREYMSATNEGTYSAEEACRKVGTGDPKWANRRVYVTVGGRVWSTGPSEARAPGYMRWTNTDAIAADRAELRALREERSRLARDVARS